MINTQRLIDNFMTDVTISSESFYEDKYANHLIEKLTALGFELIEDDTKEQTTSRSNNLIARRRGILEGPTLGFCAHMDTVSPGQNIQPIIKNNVIYSQGDTILGADDKAGITIILEILETAIEREVPLGPVEIFFSVCEESGMLGSKYLKKDLLEGKDYYILDGTGKPGQILIQGPYHHHIDMTLWGVAAHAGLCPEAGINAIDVASKAISAMTLGRISPVTTANIGSIHGGIATNVVCPEVCITAEVRSLCEDELNKQIHHMHDVLRTTCHNQGITFDFQSSQSYPGFKVSSTHPFLKYTASIIEKLGLTYLPEAGGGGSDANHMNTHNITPLILGIGITDCHTTRESIAIDALLSSAQLCYECLTHYWISK